MTRALSVVLAVVLISLISLTCGCQESPPQSAPAAPRRAVSKLLVLVVDDPPLAAGLKLLRGEWEERTGGQLEIQEETAEFLLSATELSADLVIYPSRYVGTLVDRDWIRPVRKPVLQSESLAIGDIFPLIRNITLPYGGQIYALSLGEPPLMLAGPSDSLLAVEQPSWERFEFRLNLENSSLKTPRAAELLVRGTNYSQHRSQTTSWFDAETMQPQIASLPFAKALQEMLENERELAQQADRKIALSWPSSATKTGAESVGFAPLPRAEQVYNPLREAWEDNQAAQPLVFMGFSGRSVSVSRSTRNSSSAFKLLEWLSSENIATQLSPRSNATVWFRKSQAAHAKKWLPKNEAGKEAALAITKLLSSSNYFLLPRIPGIDEYLQTLEEAINQAISAKTPAEETLLRVVGEWNALTDRYGRDRQRVAYRRHLGLDDSNE